MTEKLKVSRAIADAIEYVKREGYDYTAIMKIQINNGWERKETIPLLELDITTRTYKALKQQQQEFAQMQVNLQELMNEVRNVLEEIEDDRTKERCCNA